MPFLTDPQRALLATELAKPQYAGKTDAEAVDLLNTPGQISNGSRPKVPAPLAGRRQAIISTLSVDSRGRLATSGIIPRILDHIKDNAFAEIADSLAMITGSLITVQEAAQLTNLLKQTIDDPHWVAFRSGPTPFQAIAGLGDTPINLGSHSATGTAMLVFVQEARAL